MQALTRRWRPSSGCCTTKGGWLAESWCLRSPLSGPQSRLPCSPCRPRRHTFFYLSVDIHSYFCDHGPGLQRPIPQLCRQLSTLYLCFGCRSFILSYLYISCTPTKAAIVQKGLSLLKLHGSSLCWSHLDCWETSTPAGSSLCLWPPSPCPPNWITSFMFRKHNISRSPWKGCWNGS